MNSVVWPAYRQVRGLGPTWGHLSPYVVAGAVAILSGPSAQVNHLVEAELAAVDGRCFGFQSNDQLLWVVTGNQARLNDEQKTEIHYGFLEKSGFRFT